MDSSHGISSQNSGELEVMVHRKLLRDDGRGSIKQCLCVMKFINLTTIIAGVGEALVENTVVNPILRVFVDSPEGMIELSKRNLVDLLTGSLLTRYKQNYLLNFPLTVAYTESHVLDQWSYGSFSGVYAPLSGKLLRITITLRY
jgi:hypothetical protein